MAGDSASVSYHLSIAVYCPRNSPRIPKHCQGENISLLGCFLLFVKSLKTVIVVIFAKQLSDRIPMKAKKKKKFTLKSATQELATILGKHLKKLSPLERKKRTERVYKRLVSRLSKGGLSESDAVAKSGESASFPPARFVARNR